MVEGCRISRRGGRGQVRTLGFTLVEMLIVIAVIGILSGLVMRGVVLAKQTAAIAVTQQRISRLQIAIESYHQDEGAYPAQGLSPDADENHLPQLYVALLGEPKPHGPAGRNAPYLRIKEDDIVVWDDARTTYRKARRSERYDPDVPKFVADAWGEPLIYRCNKGQPRQDWMHNPYSFDLYSRGFDGEDQTWLDLDDASDDLGNW
jgi:prepilin-type N-terminal cleavage/methylation domain-containing protein